MRKVTVILMSMLLLVTSVMAQNANYKKEHKTPQEKAKHFTQELSNEVGLSNEQIAKVEALQVALYTKLADLKKVDMPEEAMKSKKKEIKKEAHQQLKLLLTPAQWEKFNAAKGAHKSKNKHHKE